MDESRVGSVGCQDGTLARFLVTRTASHYSRKKGNLGSAAGADDKRICGHEGRVQQGPERVEAIWCANLAREQRTGF